MKTHRFVLPPGVSLLVGPGGWIAFYVYASFFVFIRLARETKPRLLYLQPRFT